MERPNPEEESGKGESSRHRPVRSFVLRAGRVTAGQKRALEELWPQFGIEEGSGVIDFNAIFGNSHPVVLEIGFGNGDATWQMARSEPEKNFIGIEVHKPGVGHLLLKLEEHGLENVRVVCSDAVETLQRQIGAGVLSGVRLYFPDPWHKKRHHKRRIVQRDFVALLASRMKAGGILHLATDWAPYAEWMMDIMAASPEFENTSHDGAAVDRPDWRPETKYERRGERLGHQVFDLVYRRVDGF